MGNCTATIKKRTGVTPAGVAIVADLALSATYATGGDTVPLSLFGVPTIDAIIFCGGATTPGGHALEAIYAASPATAPKIRARDVATGAELTNGNDFSAQSVRVIVYSTPFA
jgi:hypothetical protein